MSNIAEILADVSEEMEDQRKQWGDQSGHTPDHWAVILGEEFGEVCRAVWDLGQSRTPNPRLFRQQLRDELIQVAAVACSWVEVLDR